MDPFDSASKDYTGLVNESISFSGAEHTFFIKLKANYLNDLLQANCKAEHPSLLDLGCGVGLMHSFIDSKTRITGVDTSTKSIEVAKSKNSSCDYRVYDGRTLPFEDESFDFCVATCVFHHIKPEDWVSSLEELKRVTKRNGHIAIFEHNPLNPLTQLAVSRCEFDKDAVLLGKRKLFEISNLAKLNTKKHQYIVFFPWEIKWLNSFEKNLRFLPLGAQHFLLMQKSD